MAQKKLERSYLEASFEVWVWRKVLRIPWAERVTNDEVLKRVNERRIIFKTIEERKEKLYSWYPTTPLKLVHHPDRGNAEAGVCG